MSNRIDIIPVMLRLADAWEDRYWVQLEVAAECRTEGELASPEHTERCWTCDGHGIIETSTHDLPTLCHACEGLGRYYEPFVDAIRLADTYGRIWHLYTRRAERAIEIEDARGAALDLAISKIVEATR